MAGNISILYPKDNFQKVSKLLILDKTVDPLSLGIYVKMISLGANWKMNVVGLAHALNVSDTKIRKAFNILEEKGFLRRKKAKNEAGRFTGWDYEIGAEPLTDIPKTPTSENTDVGENRRRENGHVYNNNISESRDINIYSESEIYRERAVPSKKQKTFEIPSLEEVRAYCTERGNKVDAEAFVAFYTSKGWKVGSAPMKDWKAAVVTWEKREATKPARTAREPRRQESVYEHNMRVYDQVMGTNLHEQYYGKD